MAEMNHVHGEPTLPLHEAMIAFLRDRREGVPSVELAERFLKLKNPAPLLAAAAIRGVLGSDRRCFTQDNTIWRIRPAFLSKDLETEKLGALPWSTLYCLADPAGRRLLFCSLWDLLPSPTCVAAGWCADPMTLPHDEREVIAGTQDVAFDPSAVPAFLMNLTTLCADRIPLFLSAANRNHFFTAAAHESLRLPEDTALISGLLKAAEITVNRPLSVPSLECAVFGNESIGERAQQQGERFARCAAEILERCYTKGIETRADLDKAVLGDASAVFTGKDFSYEDLLALPAVPGVYGFKDANDAWLYIGKAVNLRRRLLGYFTETDESPQKLSRLIAQSKSLVTHRCGSEIECLIYEYRLIKKHAPILNTQRNISERKGIFKPIHDCVILLPHAEPQMGMSLWVREGRKIRLRQFSPDFPAQSPLIEELRSFFFDDPPPPEASDFPEEEIAVRWIKQSGDSLNIVPVDRAADAGAMYDAMRIAWGDYAEKQLQSPAVRHKDNGLLHV
jgi:hypothetical protein